MARLLPSKGFFLGAQGEQGWVGGGDAARLGQTRAGHCGAQGYALGQETTAVGTMPNSEDRLC